MLSSSSSEVVVPNESKKCHHSRTGKSSFWDHFLFSGSLNSLRAKKKRKKRERTSCLQKMIHKQSFLEHLSTYGIILNSTFFSEESFLLFSFFFRIVFELMNFDPKTWFFCFLKWWNFRNLDFECQIHEIEITFFEFTNFELQIQVLFKIFAYVIFLGMARNIFRRWRSSGFIRKFFGRLGHCCSRSWGCCSRG